MPLLTVTLGAGATQFTTGPARAMQMKVWQGSDASFVGDDPAVTSSTGIPVKAASTTVDPTTIGPFTSGAINLKNWYGVGTGADVIHVWYEPEE